MSHDQDRIEKDTLYACFPKWLVDYVLRVTGEQNAGSRIDISLVGLGTVIGVAASLLLSETLLRAFSAGLAVAAVACWCLWGTLRK